MATYPNGGGSNIGALLRLIQEDQNQNIAASSPASDPESPLREVIQQPIEAPESPGSERVVSIRPEGAVQSGPQAEAVSPVAPVAPGGAPSGGGVVAPIRPAPVVSSPSDGGGSPASSPVSAPQSSSSSYSSPSIGTSIRPSSAVAGARTSQPNANYTKTVSRPTSSSSSSSFRQPSTSKSGGSLGAIGGTVGGASALSLSALIKKLPFIGSIIAGEELAGKLFGGGLFNPRKVQ